MLRFLPVYGYELVQKAKGHVNKGAFARVAFAVFLNLFIWHCTWSLVHLLWYMFTLSVGKFQVHSLGRSIFGGFGEQSHDKVNI